MNELIKNINLLHTTELGAERIKRNLGLTTDDVVAWCRQSVLSAENIQRKGKNWYVYADKCVITVNAHSYTIITAHKDWDENMTFDFKKEYKALYAPTTKPSVVDVPEMTFIMVDGKGDPNTSVAYKTALEVLYGLSYGIKMSKRGGAPPEGYFDFVVPPLEGLWWNAGGGVVTDITDKDRFCWTSMIRQPDFVTPEVFENIKTAVAKKKAGLDLSLARLQKLSEGLCAQILHVGSYDDEPGSTAVLEQFIAVSGYVADFTNKRRHHEIYLGDPRKTAPEKLKTIIRYPVVTGGGR
jgi:hypothetical protein